MFTAAFEGVMVESSYACVTPRMNMGDNAYQEPEGIRERETQKRNGNAPLRA